MNQEIDVFKHIIIYKTRTKETKKMSFITTPVRKSDCYPPSGRGLVIPIFFLSWLVAPDLRSVKTILAGKLCSFSVYSPEFS